MAFLNASLMLGGLMIAVPIILHLTMRPKPRRLVFPALRFVAPRRDANKRRLNWKRWMLLALRCAAILLLAAALARPTAESQRIGSWFAAGVLGIMGLAVTSIAGLAWARGRGRWLIAGLAGLALLALAAGSALALFAARHAPSNVGGQNAPVAAVLVFETAPRMDYRIENKSRIEAAAETARWILGQLPEGSEVGVLDSSARTAAFSADPSSAAASIERLQATFAPRPTDAIVEDALRLVNSSPLERKELYLFTDLNRRVWTSTAMAGLRSRFDEADEVNVYVVDVGVEGPTNVAIGDLTLSSDVLPRDGELVVETDLRGEGVLDERIVELLVEDVDPRRPVVRDGKVLLPEAKQRGRVTCAPTPSEPRRIEFRVKGLSSGVHHGRVRVLGQDGLAVDDERHFTVEVREAWPILLAAPRDASMRFVAESLAPFDMREQGTARFDCVQTPFEDLEDRPFSDYAALVLLDPPPLSEALWRRVGEYARGGGGVALFLGSHAGDGAAFRNDAAEALLAGRCARQVRTGGRDVFLAPHEYAHPVTAVFRDIASNVPWAEFPVFRHWELAPLASDTRVILYYNNGHAAVIERPVGSGRSITVTTPFSDTARPAGRDPWNELAFGENPWPPFILVNELVLHLVGRSDTQLNFVCGRPAALPVRDQVDPDTFQLFPPSGDPYDVRAADRRFSVPFTEFPGAYRMKGSRGGIVLRGFSANLPATESELARAEPGVLDEVIGKDRARALRGREQIERAQGRQRVGREFYPFLMLVAAVVLGLEHTIANRFYGRRDA
ncbi:MAG: hypothetical protein FJ297_06110 [Planctomycetes bacterium]|nr:hypothetical protein [Planctomycetota bacterium]